VGDSSFEGSTPEYNRGVSLGAFESTVLYKLGAIEAKIDAAKVEAASIKSEQAHQADRLAALETWKTASNARTGVIAGGTALAAPPFIKWVLDLFGG
jgi:hypothetical protein